MPADTETHAEPSSHSHSAAVAVSVAADAETSSKTRARADMIIARANDCSKQGPETRIADTYSCRRANSGTSPARHAVGPHTCTSGSTDANSARAGSCTNAGSC